jgi:salicylate hydroxylase
MAMESEGALADRLNEATSASVPEALRDYERAQRPRVESAQDNSRQLARLMLHCSRTLAAVRDIVIRFVPLKLALGPIRQLLDTSGAAPGNADRSQLAAARDH